MSQLLEIEDWIADLREEYAEKEAIPSNELLPLLIAFVGAIEERVIEETAFVSLSPLEWATIAAHLLKSDEGKAVLDALSLEVDEDLTSDEEEVTSGEA